MSILTTLVGVMLGLILAARARDVDVETDDPALIYKPSENAWPRFSNPGPGKDGPASANYYHQGEYRSTSQTGASVSLKFNGSRVAFFSDLYHTHGLMEIDLDGNKTRISTYSPLSYGTPQVKLFEADVDPRIPNHIITLTNLETNKSMGVDYFLYSVPFPGDPVSPSTSTASPSTPEPSASGRNPGGTNSALSIRPPTSPTSPSISGTSASSREPDGTETVPSDSTPSARLQTGRPNTGAPNAGAHTQVKIAVIIGVSVAIAFVLAVGIGLFVLRRRRRKCSAPLDPASPTPFSAQADPAAGNREIKGMSRLLEDDKLVRPFIAHQPDPEELAALPSQRIDKLKAAPESSSSPPLPEDAVHDEAHASAPTAVEHLQAQLERLMAENARLRHVAEPPAYSDGSARSERGDRET